MVLLTYFSDVLFWKNELGSNFKLRNKPQLLYSVTAFGLWTVSIEIFFLTFCGATDIPVLDFWWHLLWVSKPEWAAIYMLGRGIHFTCSLRFNDSCQPLGCQYGSWTDLLHIPVTRHWGDWMGYLLHHGQMLYWLSYASWLSIEIISFFENIKQLFTSWDFSKYSHHTYRTVLICCILYRILNIYLLDLILMYCIYIYLII